jgi:hypothetical protein
MIRENGKATQQSAHLKMLPQRELSGLERSSRRRLPPECKNHVPEAPTAVSIHGNASDVERVEERQDGEQYVQPGAIKVALPLCWCPWTNQSTIYYIYCITTGGRGA